MEKANMDALHIQKKIRAVTILIMCFLTFNIANAQVINNGLLKNYSKGGNSHSDVFHAITLHASFDCQSMPFLGLGYSCLQLSTKENNFTQESLTYNIGLKLDNKTISHNIIASIHANYIGKVNLNPLVYGLAFHFIAAPDMDDIPDNVNTNEYPGQLMSNLYIRPEIGISLPLKYDKKITSFLITYGYNIQTFWTRREIKNYKEQAETENLNKALIPYTSQGHHMVTMRLNFRIIPKNVRAYN